MSNLPGMDERFPEGMRSVNNEGPEPTDDMELATCDICHTYDYCVVTRGATNDENAPIVGAVCRFCNAK